MLTKTRTPDRLVSPAQDIVPVQDALAQPPGGAEAAGTGLRVITVPGGWPPYDCEIHGVACPAADPETGPQPARSAVTAESTPAWNSLPADARTGSPAGTAAADEARVATADEDRAADPDQAPGPNAAWCGQFAQVLVEVLAGYRPLKQLARATTERVQAQIDLLSCAAAGGQRPRIRRVMTSRPAAGVVEMTMVASFGSRSRAVAMRFEHVPARLSTPGRPARPARWLCTEIETS
jgi:hypothetical protein